MNQDREIILPVNDADVDRGLATSDAFAILHRTGPKFATMPIQDAINWPEFAALTDLKAWYLVVFRSLRKDSADIDELIRLEDIAAADAADQPGYIYYFMGKIPEGADSLRNLSFCMWRDQPAAVNSAMRSAHRNASAVVAAMYDEYGLERYAATVQRTVQRAWVEFEPMAALSHGASPHSSH